MGNNLNKIVTLASLKTFKDNLTGLYVESSSEDFTKIKDITEHISINKIEGKDYIIINDGIKTQGISYSDLINKPTLITLQDVTDAGFTKITLSDVKADAGIKQLLDNKDKYLTSHQSLSDYTKTTDLETVISTKGFTKFDGNYNSLSNKPSIPTKVSDLTNDSGFTSFDGKYSSLSGKPTIPTKVSDLTNDTGFTTFSGNYNDLSNKPTIPSVSIADGTITVDNVSITPITSLNGYATQSAVDDLVQENIALNQALAVLLEDKMSNLNSEQQTEYISNINARMPVTTLYRFEKVEAVEGNQAGTFHIILEKESITH